MKFSEYYEIELEEEPEWFDPIITDDTALFIDPLLIFDDEIEEFKGAYQEIMDFFNHMYISVASTRAVNIKRRIAQKMLFPEVHELCLGLTKVGTKGSGSSGKFSELILKAMESSISLGRKDLKRFEEIRIFQEGIGPDRISDMCACIIKRRLSMYTARICKELDIRTATKRFSRYYYSMENTKWMSGSVNLPRKGDSKDFVLLVPRQYLREIVKISNGDFYDFCSKQYNQIIVEEFGEDLQKKMSKREIVEIYLKNHPEHLDEYLDFRERNRGVPYNFHSDPDGRIIWHDITSNYVNENDISIDINKPENISQEILSLYERLLHDSPSYALFKAGGLPKVEPAYQNLFKGLVGALSRRQGFIVEPINAPGVNPFEISFGENVIPLDFRVKKLSNSKFWNNSKNLRNISKTDSITQYVGISFDEKNDKTYENLTKAYQESPGKNKISIIHPYYNRSEKMKNIEDSGASVVLIIALEEEFDVVHESLDLIPIKEHLNLYSTTICNTTDYAVEAICINVSAMGLVKAALATQKIIDQKSPQILCSIGISAGISNDVNLCDVVVGDQIVDYMDKSKAVQSDGGFGFELAGETYRTSNELLKIVSNLRYRNASGYESWRKASITDYQEEEGEALPAKHLVGPVASGNSVSASTNFVQFLKKTNRKYLALEMEAAGMMIAKDEAYESSAKTLVLRGVSDFGDERKSKLDNESKGKYRKKAMQNALSFLELVIDSFIKESA